MQVNMTTRETTKKRKWISRHTSANAVGVFESKHHCHPLSRVSIRSSAISLSGIQKPSERFRPSKRRTDRHHPRRVFGRSEKCRGESVRSGGGIILALAPAYSPFLPWSLFWGAASLLRAQSWEGWSGNTVKCQRGLFLAVAGSITNTTCMSDLTVSE